jgi:uncharacterized membrane protein
MAKTIKKTKVKKVAKPAKSSKKSVAKPVKIKTKKKKVLSKSGAKKVSLKKSKPKKASGKKVTKKKSETSKKPATKKTALKKVSKKKSEKKKNIKVDSNPKEIFLNDAVQKGINPLEKEVMLILSKNPQGIIQTEIYEELGASKKNRTMTILAKMSKDGIIRRERSGRTFLVFAI